MTARRLQDHILHAFASVIASASLATVCLLWRLDTTVAIMRQQSENQQADLKNVKLDIATLRNQVSSNELEVVRVRAQCEAAWSHKP